MREGIDCRGKEWIEMNTCSKNFSADQDLTGKQIGQLFVLFRVQNDKHGNSQWLTICTCGNYIVVLGGNLRKGTTQSCGCTTAERYAKARVIDMTGKRCGKLIVLHPVGVFENYGMVWHCLCDCGNECDVSGKYLRSGHTASCGCLRREVAAKNFFIDLTGRTFGYLTVLERVENDGRRVMWKCSCLCGGEVVVNSASLINGSTTSCGCRRTSFGEEKIKFILDNNHINYLYNRGYFRDLCGDGGKPLRYDFILFDENNSPFRIIEFDGPQHDSPQSFFGGNEKFIQQQRHDVLKNQYALSHNIPLVRIPYSKRDTMKIEDLLGDKYLI